MGDHHAASGVCGEGEGAVPDLDQYLAAPVITDPHPPTMFLVDVIDPTLDGDVVAGLAPQGAQDRDLLLGHPGITKCAPARAHGMIRRGSSAACSDGEADEAG